MAKLLVGAGAVVDDGQGPYTYTALHASIAAGHTEVVEFLVHEAGADVRLRSWSDGFPEHIAASRGHLDVLKLVIGAAGIDVTDPAGDPEGLCKTELHCAAENGAVEVVRFLLDAGAPVDYPDPEANGGTALHYAAGKGHRGVVTLLLDRGAGIEARCSAGATALETACAHGSVDVASLLLLRGADPAVIFRRTGERGGSGQEGMVVTLQQAKAAAAAAAAGGVATFDDNDDNGTRRVTRGASRRHQEFWGESSAAKGPRR